MKNFLARFCFLAAAGAAMSCARAGDPPSQKPSGQPWTRLRFEREFCGEDDWESFNRSMFALTDVGMTWVADPLCHLYCSIVPRPVIDSVNNAVANLRYPVRCLAALLRGEGGGAWDETKRFLINTTVGIAGLFDPAEDWWGIHSTDASFAGTFAAWGMDAGPTLALPFTPCASVRDNAGHIVDLCLNPKNYVDIAFPTGIGIGWTAALWPNYLPDWVAPWNDAVAPRADRYHAFTALATARSSLMNDLWAYRRANTPPPDERPPVRAEIARPGNLAGRWQTIPGYAPRTPALDTLRSQLFHPRRDNDFWWDRHSIFNRDFARDAEDREVLVPGTREPTRYSFVPPARSAAAQPDRLVFVIPGIGGRRVSDATLAMGEIFQETGCAAVLCDNLFHWGYLRSANNGILPGNLPEDARRFAAFMTAVLDDLSADEKIGSPEIMVVGWSMGALTALHTAAVERQMTLPFTVTRYLAVNPPVDFGNAFETIEGMQNVSCGWDRDQARRVFLETAGELCGWSARRPRDLNAPVAGESAAGWNHTPNISDEDAKFLIALSMNLTIPELLAESHMIHAFPWVRSTPTALHRREFLAEVESANVHDYVARWLAFFYPGMDEKALIQAAGLRAIRETLARDTRITMIHTWDDIFLTPADRRFLDDTLGDRLTWFAEGAHCGMFYTEPFQAELLHRLGLSRMPAAGQSTAARTSR